MKYIKKDIGHQPFDGVMRSEREDGFRKMRENGLHQSYRCTEIKIVRMIAI